MPLQRLSRRRPAPVLAAPLIARAVIIALVAWATSTSTGDARTAQAPAAPISVAGSPVVLPSELFAGFPAVRHRQSFAAARTAIERSGAVPATSGDRATELAWDGRFAGHEGRATLLFAPGSGLRQITVLLQAPVVGQTLLERLEAQIVARQGAAEHQDRSALDRSLSWRPRAGVQVSLRQTFSRKAPVVVLSWISP